MTALGISVACLFGGVCIFSFSVSHVFCSFLGLLHVAQPNMVVSNETWQAGRRSLHTKVSNKTFPLLWGQHKAGLWGKKQGRWDQIHREKIVKAWTKKTANIKNTIHLWTVACKLGLTFESAHRVCFIPMHEVCVTFVSTNVTHIFLHAWSFYSCAPGEDFTLTVHESGGQGRGGGRDFMLWRRGSVV